MTSKHPEFLKVIADVDTILRRHGHLELSRQLNFHAGLIIGIADANQTSMELVASFAEKEIAVLKKTLDYYKGRIKGLEIDVENVAKGNK